MKAILRRKLFNGASPEGELRPASHLTGSSAVSEGTRHTPGGRLTPARFRHCSWCLAGSARRSTQPSLCHSSHLRYGRLPRSEATGKASRLFTEAVTVTSGAGIHLGRMRGAQLPHSISRGTSARQHSKEKATPFLRAMHPSEA